MFIPGIIVDLCDVHRAKRFRKISNTSLVAAPHVGVGNKVSATHGPRPYARDASFGAIESNEYQMNLIAKRTSSIHQGEARMTRKSCLHGETLVSPGIPQFASVFPSQPRLPRASDSTDS